MLPGPWPRVTKRSTGGFTGSTFHFDFALQSFLFQGLFMRELKELTAVSDSHLLVGFLLLGVFKAHFISDIFYLFQLKGAICSPGRDKTS